MPGRPPVVLFGYETSTFTQKVQYALRIKQVAYTFVPVPSMMPRPLLRNSFNLLYRKIPVLAIGHDVYCDTAIILEAVEHVFSEGYPSLFPKGKDGKRNKAMIRGFASYWVDRPLFRFTTGLIPAAVWRSSFGKDRGGLIGHTLDPDKLEAKIPQNLAGYDTQLSILESQLDLDSEHQWLFSTPTPSLADVALYYQMNWGNNIANGKGIYGLTAGEYPDTDTKLVEKVFNEERYPALFKWFHNFKRYVDELPLKESRASSEEAAIELLRKSDGPGAQPFLLPTKRATLAELDSKTGLVAGARVTVAPDDTGRDNPTNGTLLAMSPEEIVIKPEPLDPPATVQVHIHFPRVGFVVRPQRDSKV